MNVIYAEYNTSKTYWSRAGQRDFEKMVYDRPGAKSFEEFQEGMGLSDQ